MGDLVLHAILVSLGAKALEVSILIDGWRDTHRVSPAHRDLLSPCPSPLILSRVWSRVFETTKVNGGHTARTCTHAQGERTAKNQPHSEQHALCAGQYLIKTKMGKELEKEQTHVYA